MMDKLSQIKLSVENFWETMAKRAESLNYDGHRPVMVIDLDGTIVDYTLRTRMIFLKAIELNGLPLETLAQIENLAPQKYEFNPKETLANAGIADSQTVAKLYDFWKRYYFSNCFLEYDKQMPGALEFVQHIRQHQIDIVYLTGRDYQNMGEGTRAWLEANRFLNQGDYRHRLLMKDDLSYINYEAKARNREKITKLGKPIILIDNEPIELFTMLGHFPEAYPVLVETPNSGRPAELPEHTLKIKDFSELNSHFQVTV